MYFPQIQSVTQALLYHVFFSFHHLIYARFCALVFQFYFSICSILFFVHVRFMFFLSFYLILNAFYIILTSTMIGYCVIVCRPHFDFIVLTNDHSSVHNQSPSVVGFFSPLLCLYAKPYEFRMWSISVDLYCVCTMRLNGMALACDLLTATST